MQATKKAVLAMLAMGATLTMGCARHSNKEVYYLISANQALPYWQTAAAGFKQAAAQYGVTARVDGPDGYDAKAEADTLTKAIAAKPAGILISVADVATVQPGINAAVSAGIPVITVDSDAVGSRRLYFIGTNNLEAGRLGGREVIAKLGGRGNVVFFTIAGQNNMDERLKGFKDVFSTRPEIKIVDVVDIKNDPVSAFDKVQQYMALTGDKKINAYVCLDSASGKPVADAVARDKSGQIVVTWDVSQDTLNAINAGTIDATVAQKPYTMGFVGLKALDEVYHYPPKDLTKDYAADPFSQYPTFVDTGTSLVDKNNVDLYLAAAAAQAK